MEFSKVLLYSVIIGVVILIVLAMYRKDSIIGTYRFETVDQTHKQLSFGESYIMRITTPKGPMLILMADAKVYMISGYNGMGWDMYNGLNVKVGRLTQNIINGSLSYQLINSTNMTYLEKISHDTPAINKTYGYGEIKKIFEIQDSSTIAKTKKNEI